MSLRSTVATLFVAGLSLLPGSVVAQDAAAPPATGPASGPAALPADAKMTLFLLVGQSNMAGRGVVAEQDKVPLPRVWTLDAQGQWVAAVDPIHFDKPKVAGVGLGRTFGKFVSEALPDVHVGLIPCAMGGTSIDQWKVGGALHAEAVRRAKLAMARGTIGGILWHQGESNSSPNGMPNYAAKLDAVVDGFRSQLEAPDAPLVVGKLGTFRLQKSPGTAAFNDMLARYASERPNTACVDTDGLTSVGDDTHFDAKSQRELGKRYAAAYLKLATIDAPTTQPTTRPARQ